MPMKAIFLFRKAQILIRLFKRRIEKSFRRFGCNMQLATSD